MRFAPILLACLSLVSARAAETEAPPAGLKVATAGHSFHVWMPTQLKELALQAKIEGHEQLALSSIGGSRVIQHWDVPDEKNKVKPVLIAGKADVLTLSPIYLPDEGIAKFVALGLEHNPKLRITVQEFWMPFDSRALWFKRSKDLKIDHDAKPIAELRAEHEPYFREMDDHVRELNAKHGREAVFVVPVGQAVLALREKISKGEAPGLSKQEQLFTDTLGHPAAHIRVLSGYCHYAVIYRRSPVGFPMPLALLKGADAAKLSPDDAQKLNALLQQIAWDEVRKHPLSGVK